MDEFVQNKMWWNNNSCYSFDAKTGNFEWELTVEIPFEVIDIHPENLPEMLRANFYKCADGTSVPHYLSWSHIGTDTSDFHRLEFFCKILFWLLCKSLFSLIISILINKGRSEIRKLATFFAQVFNIRITDVYRTYLEIKNSFYTY